jgi:hypothetical protein
VIVDVLVLLLLPAAAGVYLSWTAGRVDRMHRRVEAARAALDAQLVRRSAVALELATSRLLDPAAALVVAGAAHEAREAGRAGEVDRELAGERGLAESNLSRALRAVLDQPGQHAELAAGAAGQILLAELEEAQRRVVMARRFHNDAVRATRALRRKRIVRYGRLAGRAPLPQPFECDDAPPECLARAL